MKKNYYLVIAFILISLSTYAQFPQNENQTFYVCDTVNVQNSVRATADGKGGTYSIWIDKRAGTTGTAIFGQHLDSLGNPQWTANGKFIVGATSKEIWAIDGIQWQNGFLIAWIQGGFGVGADTLFCNYFDANGDAIWAHPTVVANKQAGVLYVDYGNLNIYSTAKGALICYSLEPFGNDVFSFNRVDFNGNLRWPLDSIKYTSGGWNFQTASDHHDGVYVAAAGGGLGSHIYVGHFDSSGVSTFANPVDVSTIAGGRGNDAWNIVADKDTNAYVVWDDTYGALDLHIAKVKPNGTFPWGGGGDKTICNATGTKDYPSVIIAADTIYVAWDDSRAGGTRSIYIQKLDTAGNGLWIPNGVLMSNLTSYIPYPKMIKTGNNIIVGIEVNSGFRAQQVQPDSTIVWQANGIPINNSHPPLYGDYAIVANGNGNNTAIWSDGDNICAARIRPDGTLTHVASLNNSTTSIYPNPVTDYFTVRIAQPAPQAVTISMYNTVGQLVQQQNVISNESSFTVPANNLPAGIYVVKLTGENYLYSGKICVVR